MGTVGRSSGQVRLQVLNHTSKEEVQENLEAHRARQGVCYSDEHQAYQGVETLELRHKTVCHSAREWARDDDGDGIRGTLQHDGGILAGAAQFPQTVQRVEQALFGHLCSHL